MRKALWVPFWNRCSFTLTQNSRATLLRIREIETFAREHMEETSRFAGVKLMWK